MFGRASEGRDQLGKYITQIRGVSYKPSDLFLSKTEQSIVLLRANNISNGQINHNDVQYIDKNKVTKVQLIRNGDIIICASSGSLDYVGKAALCQNCCLGETIGAFCKLIRPKGFLKSEYIAAYFNSVEYRRIINSLVNGTNINNLKNEHIDELQIYIPSCDEQDCFVEFSNHIDKLRFDFRCIASKWPNKLRPNH